MTPKSFEEIKENIENLDINENLEENVSEILDDIKNIEDEQQKVELYLAIIDKIKKHFISKTYENKEQIKNDFDKFKNIILSSNATLENFLFKMGFNLDEILNKRKENGLEFSSPVNTKPESINTKTKKEIDIINERIAEIENKYLNLARHNRFKLALNKKLNELKVSISTINNEEEKNKTKAIIEEIQKEIEILSNSNNYLSRETLVEIAEKYDISIDEIENIIRNENPDIKEELHSIEELERLNNDISNSVENISLTEEEKKEMQAITAELSKRENKYGRMTEEELQKEAKKNKDIINIKKVMVGEEQRELLKIEQELAKRKNPNGMSLDELRKKYNDMSLDDLIDEEKRLKDIINIKKVMIGEEQKQLQELQNILSKRENKYGRMTKEELQKEAKKLKDIINIKKEMVGEEQRELSKIKEELEKRSRNDFSNIPKQKLQKRLEELEKKSKKSPKTKEEIKKQLDEKLDAQDLLKFKGYKNAYDKIFSEGIKKFENSNDDENLQENIEKFVKTHELAKKINDYEKKDKLINELISDIHEAVRKKVITSAKVEPNIWYKVLAGAVGFTAGFGLSLIPGVCPVLTTINGAKLTLSAIDYAINIYTKNHDNGVVKRITKAKEWMQKSWLGKLREKLNNPYIKWGLNGFAAGYIFGNVIEMINGEPLLDSIKKKIAPEDLAIENEIVPENIIPEVEIVPEIPKAGDVLDLSELEFGRISSDAEKAVHLMEGIGKEVEFDKIKVLSDGTEMWHFKQLNGNGYAWFPKEEVMKILKKQAVKAAKLANSRIM